MALPPDIRVNVKAPFPALVEGSGPVTVAKANGIWTIGFTITAFATTTPPIASWPTDYVLAWDDVAKTYIKVSLTDLAAAGARIQRLVTASPISVQTNDQIINVNIASGSPSCTLPLASSRFGVPLSFKDVGGNFGAHGLTITPAGGDTIDGLSSLVLSTDHQGINLVPANDGTTTGWFIA